MTDKSPSFSAISYAFEMRAELPSNMGLFYVEAGTARDAFDASRRELPGNTFHIAQDNSTAARSRDGRAEKWRTPGYALPDPHPSFAAPNRKLRNETWFQTLRTREDGVAMTRDEFMNARSQGAKDRNRNHKR